MTLSQLSSGHPTQYSSGFDLLLNQRFCQQTFVVRQGWGGSSPGSDPLGWDGATLAPHAITQLPEDLHWLLVFASLVFFMLKMKNFHWNTESKLQLGIWFLPLPSQTPVCPVQQKEQRCHFLQSAVAACLSPSIPPSLHVDLKQSPSEHQLIGLLCNIIPGVLQSLVSRCFNAGRATSCHRLTTESLRYYSGPDHTTHL